jgi:alpha-mannosidase
MIYKYRGQYENVSPVLFFNAFNNSWGTNFPQWMGGDYTFRYRLIPHTGDWKQGEIARKAFESVTPVLAVFSSGGKDEGSKLPPSYSLINSIEGMEILALKPAENGEGFILRLREINGEPHKIDVVSAVKFASIAECDLQERIQKEVAADANQFSFETAVYEIHSFYLKI